MPAGRSRLPSWMKVPMPGRERYGDVRSLLRRQNLHTVCQSARCPNIGECFGQGTATFLIMGDRCTRNCRFCNVSPGHPGPLDREEPERLAAAVAELELVHAVITSVTRDDLADGGASHFASTIEAVRRRSPGTTIEVLIPDFQGNEASLRVVLEARPDVLNHNIETVPRLYSRVRPQADYHRSLTVLLRAKEMMPSVVTKSGLMVGLGEQTEELLEVLGDLRAHQCSALTIGQYLSPSSDHVPIARFYDPTEFVELERRALALGITHVQSGPLVRSSYHARHFTGNELEEESE